MYCGAEHILVFADVFPTLARSEFPLSFKKVFDPSVFCFVRDKADALSCGHGKKMIYSQLLKPFIVFVIVFGKYVNKSCVERKQSFLNGKTDGNGRKTFADGIHYVRHVGAKRECPRFIGDFSVTQYHKAVYFDAAAFKILQKICYSL